MSLHATHRMRWYVRTSTIVSAPILMKSWIPMPQIVWCCVQFGIVVAHIVRGLLIIKLNWEIERKKATMLPYYPLVERSKIDLDHYRRLILLR
jgi:hypothetical protein